jgi:hypothetical protein
MEDTGGSLQRKHVERNGAITLPSKAIAVAVHVSLTPKFVVADGPEVVRHLIAERFPLIWGGFLEELVFQRVYF